VMYGVPSCIRSDNGPEFWHAPQNLIQML